MYVPAAKQPSVPPTADSGFTRAPKHAPWLTPGQMVRPPADTAMNKLRIVVLRFGTARQKTVLE